MTVEEFKTLVMEWPNLNDAGEDNEVWMMTGKNLSSEVDSVMRLGHGDLLVSCRQWDAP